MAESPYVVEYRDTFTFGASPEQIWLVLEHFEALAVTWPWLRELRVDGAGLAKGVVVRGVVVPPLPYRMRLAVVIEDSARGEYVNASVRGDLEGCAHIELEGAGSETRAHVAWTIEIMQPTMRLAARVSPRLLRWGHDRVVAASVRRLRRQLAAEHP